MRDEFQHHSENRRRARQGQIVVEFAEVFHNTIVSHAEHGFCGDVGSLLQGGSDPADQVGQGTAGVRQNHLAIRVFDERPLKDHVHGGSACFVRVVDHRLGKEAVHPVCVDRVCWMNEDHAFAFVQLGPDRLDGRVPEIGVGRAVASKQRDPVSFEVVECVPQLLERCGRVQNIWQTREESKSLGIAVADFRSFKIEVAGQSCRLSAFRDARAGRRDRQNGSLGADSVHQPH